MLCDYNIEEWEKNTRKLQFAEFLAVVRGFNVFFFCLTGRTRWDWWGGTQSLLMKAYLMLLLTMLWDALKAAQSDIHFYSKKTWSAKHCFLKFQQCSTTICYCKFNKICIDFFMKWNYLKSSLKIIKIQFNFNVQILLSIHFLNF